MLGNVIDKPFSHCGSLAENKAVRPNQPVSFVVCDEPSLVIPDFGID
jgi:hypothetical protein